MDTINVIFDFLRPYASWGDVCRGIYGLFSLYALWRLFWDYFYSTSVELSIGSFRMRKKDLNVQNVTNIVSLKFYDGGQIPGNIRKEILEITCPKTWNINKVK